MGAQGQQTAEVAADRLHAPPQRVFAISGAIILAGAVSLGVRGLNLGIDFKGGTQVTFKTQQALRAGRRRGGGREVG